jgi:hypothetical protein
LGSILTWLGFLRIKGLLEEGIEASKQSRPTTDSGNANDKKTNKNKRKHEEVDKAEFVLPFQNEDLGAILEKMKQLEVHLLLVHLIRSARWRD